MRRSLFRLGAVLAAGVFAMTTIAAPAGAAPRASDGVSAQAIIAEGYYVLRNANSGKCLTAGGKVLVQSTCVLGAGYQTWYFRNIAGDNTYEIRNFASGNCLAIGGSRTDDGAGAIGWPCAGIADQTWYISGDSGGYTLVNANSGKCLAIGGSRTDDGAGAIQWTCAGIADQRWLNY